MSSLFKLFKLWTSESELQTSAACRSSKAAFTSLAILFVLNSRGSPLTTTRIQCQRVLSTFSVVFWLSRGVCAGKCCKVLMSSRIHTVESPAFEHFEQFAFELFSHSALDSVFGSQFYLFGSLRCSSLRVFSALQLSLHSSIRLSSQLYSVRLFIRLFIRLLIQCGRYSVALKAFLLYRQFPLSLSYQRLAVRQMQLIKRTLEVVARRNYPMMLLINLLDYNLLRWLIAEC